MGKHTLTLPEIEVFKNMLAFDQLRGVHSTGLFGLFRPYNKEPFYKVNKECMEGVDFVRSPMFANAIGHVNQQGAGVTSTEWAKAMFGHNRYATQGAINAVNAHPFTHGHITLAHNGTLRNQSLLPDSEKFEVDSENICYSINKIGVKETVKRLNGAFALIWFDSEKLTMNILRNSEREFHLFETSSGDWFGCSEEKMGDWLLTRGRNGKTIKRHFECVPGTQYIFDVSSGCKLKEGIEHELPTFSACSYYNQGVQGTEEESWEQWYEGRKKWHSRGTGNVPGTTQKKETLGFAGLMQKFGLDMEWGQQVEFEQYEYKPYTDLQGKETGFGMVVGWMDKEDEYIEVQVHQVKKEHFSKNGSGYAEVFSAFEKNTCLHLLAKVVTEDISTPPLLIEHENTSSTIDEDECPFLSDTNDSSGEDNDVLVTASGERFTLKEWRNSRHNTCCECGDPILFDDVTDAVIVNGYCFCEGCSDSKKDKEGPRPGTTSNGVTYSRKEWDSKCMCESCGHKFNYNEAHDTESLDTYIFCQDEIACNKRQNSLDKALDSEFITDKAHGFCEACNQVHTVYVRTGNMSAESWQKLKENCKTKEKYRVKFQKMINNRETVSKVRHISAMTQKVTREVLSLKPTTPSVVPCTCCGYEFLSDKIKGGVCVTCSARFQGEENGKINNIIPFTKKGENPAVAAPTIITDSKDLKWFEKNPCPDCGWVHTNKIISGKATLLSLKSSAVKGCRLVKYWEEQKGSTGKVYKQINSQPPMRVCKEGWKKIGKCRKCGDEISFNEADQVKFWGSAPICLNCQHDNNLAMKGSN